MWASYFTIAIRNLIKHKANTFISLFGLLAGISSALVLSLYAYQELTFDTMHDNVESTYVVSKEWTTPSGSQIVYGTWVPMLEAMKDEYLDVTDGARMFGQQGFLTISDKQFTEHVTFADPSLFSIFHLPTEHGNAVKFLQNKSAVILSHETASRFFGSEDAIGKPIRLVMNGFIFDLVVADVMKPLPANSSVRPDVVIPFQNAMDIPAIRQGGWGSAFLVTYLQISAPSAALKLEGLFPGFVKKYFNEEMASRMKFKLVPMMSYHDQVTSSSRAAYVMICIAFIIVLIAVVNYINLTTVRSVERTREIGLRKVLGASRGSLTRQFLTESLLLTTLALAGAFIVLQASLPWVNQLLGTAIDMNVLATPRVLFILLGVFFLVGLSSGSCPAFFISKYKTIESIKGKVKSSPTGTSLKRVLIVLQFSLSVILFFSSLVIYRQIKFMKNHDLGINKDNVLVIRTDTNNMMDPQGARVRVTSAKQQLLQDSRITHVAASDVVPSDISLASFTLTRPDGWIEDEPFRLMRVSVDESYFKLYDVKFIAGENFHEHMSSLDTAVRNFAIINGAAMKAFGWKDIEDKKAGRHTLVVGVVEDHHYDNLARAVEPVMFVYRTTEHQPSKYLSVRIAGDPSAVMPMIESTWRTIDSTRPFSYFFVDDRFDSLYRHEEQSMTIITWFSTLAIVIACMGLWGLISFTVTQKVREIGIRKVLGSSVSGIVVLLNREFLVLILIALAVAVPLGYLAMNRWLTDFAVKTDIPWSIFATVAIVMIALALITTTVRIWSAANANPVDSLRND